MSETTPPAGTRPTTLAAAERQVLLEALDASRGNIKSAAKLAGCSRSAFYSKLERHGLHERRGERPPTTGEAIAERIATTTGSSEPGPAAA